MSVGNVTRIMDRIKSAPKDSPIVVTLAPKKGFFNAFFYNTVYGKEFVALKPITLVGVFHGEMDLSVVKRTLEKAG